MDDLNNWADKGRTTYKNVRALLKEALRTPFEGTGKPEPLKYQLGNVWSRRITQEHRLVYASRMTSSLCWRLATTMASERSNRWAVSTEFGFSLPTQTT